MSSQMLSFEEDLQEFILSVVSFFLSTPLKYMAIYR